MKCISCSFDDTEVRDSRPASSNTLVRRRRYCPKCDARFTTYELDMSKIENLLKLMREMPKLGKLLDDACGHAVHINDALAPLAEELEIRATNREQVMLARRP